MHVPWSVQVLLAVAVCTWPCTWTQDAIAWCVFVELVCDATDELFRVWPWLLVHQNAPSWVKVIVLHRVWAQPCRVWPWRTMWIACTVIGASNVVVAWLCARVVRDPPLERHLTRFGYQYLRWMVCVSVARQC